MDGVDASGVEQDALGERGLAAVNVGGDADVAHVGQRRPVVVGHTRRQRGVEPAPAIAGPSPQQAATGQQARSR